jgi:hypothetical protein
MNAKVVTFSSLGDTTLLEYDPVTADMDEVNRVIAEYEARTGAHPLTWPLANASAKLPVSSAKS